MIGQDKLTKQINTYTLDTFPHSVILLGPKGCGKHTLVNEIAGNLHLNVVYITESISINDIDQFMIKPEPYIYVFDANVLSIKQQNVILKFVEEPLKNAYIIILCETKRQLIDTVLNRCIIWTFETYSKETLRTCTFVNKVSDIVLELSNTPGDIIELSLYEAEIPDTINKMIQLSNKLLTSSKRATVANILTVADKCYYKESDKDNVKFNFNIFLKVLMYVIQKNLVDNGSKELYNVYNRTNQLYNDCFIPNINKQYLFESYLLDMKVIT
jgi:replication-associated recombination protein RarA